MAPWLHCLYYEQTKTGKAGPLGEKGERRAQKPSLEDAHGESEPLSVSRSWYSMHWHQALSHWNQTLTPPKQKLLPGARCLCNTKKDAKKGNLKMWFSVEGLQYSKMLLFLLSLPFIYSEPGLLTWVTRSYFCFFLQLFLQSKCMIKGQSAYVLKNKQHDLGF